MNGAVLGKEEIQQALSDPRSGLIITPVLDLAQIGATSVDLRLGSEFIITKRANVPAIHPLARDYAALGAYQWHERILVPRGRELVLHPGELILGASLEYLSLPRDIGAYVTSRSSWGRVGLVIATAISVAPGFRGVITLELTNVGNAPLVLSPGVRIAQIVFHRTNSSSAYAGRYRCPTGPELGRIQNDTDLEFWCPQDGGSVP